MSDVPAVAAGQAPRPATPSRFERAGSAADEYAPVGSAAAQADPLPARISVIADSVPSSSISSKGSNSAVAQAVAAITPQRALELSSGGNGRMQVQTGGSKGAAAAVRERVGVAAPVQVEVVQRTSFD